MSTCIPLGIVPSGTAVLYSNAEMIIPDEVEWIAHPQFLVTSSLEERYNLCEDLFNSDLPISITRYAAGDAAEAISKIVAQVLRATPQFQLEPGKGSEVIWKAMIEQDSIIEGKIAEIKLVKKDFQPSKIYKQLLKASLLGIVPSRTDLSLMIPTARCFYLRLQGCSE